MSAHPVLSQGNSLTRTLILIPTRAERLCLQPRLEPSLGCGDRVELCGFGLVAAAARSSQLIQSMSPDQVILAGLAGTFRDDLPVGSAAVFREVSCYGIGAGSGAEHQTAGDIGWNHIGDERTESVLGEDVLVGDTIELGHPEAVHEMNRSRQLLSVAAASGNSDDASIRLARFPNAAAEDMEGFAVAMACRLAKIPLAIVRGISNRVGDRNTGNWQIKPALDATIPVVRQLKAVW